MRKLRNSLFLKIYLTLLACLVAVALASAVFMRLSHDEDDRSWASRRDAFVEAMLPADSDPGDQRLLLRRLAAAFDADLSLYARDGRLLEAVGTQQPFPRGEDGRRFRAGEPGQHLVLRLEDGRVLVARLGLSFGPPRASPLGWLALVAGVTGLVAWPVVRHLTRRLERLRGGVEAWGHGDLARRVTIEGRDEVAAVAASFNRAAEQVEKLVASHRSLLANASHELRSPLARLRMAVDLYEDNPNEARKAEIVRNLAELDELVEEILLASRLDHVEAIDTSRAVDLLALAAEEGARHGVEVTGEAADVAGDPRLLARLVRNLVQNALRHGAPPVTVAVRRVGATVELAVRDQGQGIPDGEGERVFEAFYRPAQRGEAAGGWGLGLALVRQIAGRHGAAVRHETPADGGARFVVSFPASANIRV